MIFLILTSSINWACLILAQLAQSAHLYFWTIHINQKSKSVKMLKKFFTPFFYLLINLLIFFFNLILYDNSIFNLDFENLKE